MDLFGSAKRVANNEGYIWTISDSHHDNFGHTCVDDWDNTRAAAQNSIPSAFVYSTGTSNSGNSGVLGCANHDGNEWHLYFNASAIAVATP